MKSFMATGSLPWGTEVIEAPIEDDVVPFPGEDVVMMVFERSSLSEKHHIFDPSKGAHPTVTRNGETKKCKDTNFCLYINVCNKNMCVYSRIYAHIHCVHTGSNKKAGSLAIGVTQDCRGAAWAKYQHRELAPPPIATPG
jgi:hypothetical protein